MVNSSISPCNITQVSIDSRILGITQMVIVIFIVLFFCFFLYLIALLLSVYFTTPHVQENARYILFAHMLINDALYLSASNGLFLTATYAVHIPVPICYAATTLAASTFRITSYNLAAMSLERYVAICYPLRHFQFCSSQRANMIIIFMWVVGVMPNVADFFAMKSSVQDDFFSLYVLCNRAMLAINPLQSTIRSITFISSLTLVALLIVFTYIKVMLVARKIGSGTSSAFKAGRTVMLHAVQLLLCMTAFISTITETIFEEYFIYLILFNFLAFTFFPRFLSPVIYGIRDEVFRKYIRKFYRCNYA
ncbi:odorant receptor 131-2-like [Pelodytes ibericus]